MKRWLLVPLSIVALSIACTSKDEAPANVSCEGGDCVAPAGTKPLGEACTSPADCASTLCVQVVPSEGAGGRVCSQDCSAEGCPSGWECGSVAERRACLCVREAETCDGRDNDCDGVIDGPAANAACDAASAGEVCDRGQCTCLLRCDGRCVDPRQDPDNCGACGKSCGGFGTCADRSCVCSLQASLCDGRCVATTNDPKNCGACGKECARGESCFAGKCECRLATCGGSCVDTTSDRQNCSECGRGCAGDCQASTCVAQTLVTGQGKPDFLVANDTDLFWVSTEGGRIQRCPLADCDASTLTTLETLSGVTAVAATGRYAFWGNGTSLRRFDGATQTITTMAAADVVAVAVDEAFVYFRDKTAGTVTRCPLGGDCSAGAQVIASRLAPGAGALSVAEGKLFIAFAKTAFRSGYPSGPIYGLHVCPREGCPSSPPPIFAHQGGFAWIQQFGVANGRVYWSSGDSDYPFGELSRQSCPTAGCGAGPTPLADVDDFGAADGDYVFWVEANTPAITADYRLFACVAGEIRRTDGTKIVQCTSPRAALRSALPRVGMGGSIEASLGRPRSPLVVRGGFVYFAEPAGTIRRVERPR